MARRIWGLEIKGIRYVAVQVPGPPRRYVALVKSRGPTYHVTRFSYGIECTCGDFTFRRNHLDPRGCKHVLALLKWGLI